MIRAVGLLALLAVLVAAPAAAAEEGEPVLDNGSAVLEKYPAEDVAEPETPETPTDLDALMTDLQSEDEAEPTPEEKRGSSGGSSSRDAPGPGVLVAGLALWGATAAVRRRG